AYQTLSKVDINAALEKKKITTINKVSSFIKNQFEKKNKKLFYDDNETYSSDDEPSEELETNIKIILNSDDENSSEDDEEEDLPSISASGKYRFDGMRVINSVSPALSDSYFSVEIDGEKKYIHKQTACWLLTDSKDNLSADRLKRVQQSGR
ncbi:unnamed protein product, partial [Rotaria magnacalcarata]